MTTITNISTNGTLPYTKKHELFSLAEKFDENTFLYILRSLYRIVFKSNQLKEDKLKLARRIRDFENTSRLPNTLTQIPINQLLVDC